MITQIFLASILIASSPAIAGSGIELTAEELAERPSLCLAPEMSLIPEVDTWEECAADAFPESAAELKAEWAKLAPWAASKLRPPVVRALSRWARTQMENYAVVPALEKITFKPVTRFKGKNAIVYEAVIDELPVHNPLVTRQLMGYILYSSDSKSILRVTFTIRGQVTE